MVLREKSDYPTFDTVYVFIMLSENMNIQAVETFSKNKTLGFLKKLRENWSHTATTKYQIFLSNNPQKNLQETLTSYDNQVYIMSFFILQRPKVFLIELKTPLLPIWSYAVFYDSTSRTHTQSNKSQVTTFFPERWVFENK